LQVIDCDPSGKFSLEILKRLHTDDYEGVIYSNSFCQYSDWDEVFNWCVANGKQMVVDNSSGLFDRATGVPFGKGCIEVVSADHTKPWGIGDIAFLIMDRDLDKMAREIRGNGSVFSTRRGKMPSTLAPSEVGVASLLDRLERFSYYSQFYFKQARRMKALVTNFSPHVSEFTGTTIPQSPRAFTPFLADAAVRTSGVETFGQYRKYNDPLLEVFRKQQEYPNASRLHRHCLWVSNAPMMRCLSEEEIHSDLSRMLGATRS